MPHGSHVLGVPHSYQEPTIAARLVCIVWSACLTSAIGKMLHSFEVFVVVDNTVSNLVLFCTCVSPAGAVNESGCVYGAAHM